jgi:hypothetical protein
VLIGTIPLAWLAVWWNARQDERFGVPDVTIAAPDNKPVLSSNTTRITPGGF